MKLRPATMGDAHDLFGWRNHPSTRQMMRETQEFSFESHIQWLEKTLDDPSKQLLIAEDGGAPVGQVRFDNEENGSHELSWTIAPDVRGKGIGTKMLQEAVKHAEGNLRAEIKKDNIASQKMAERAGFVFDGEDKKEGMFHYVLIRF